MRSLIAKTENSLENTNYNCILLTISVTQKIVLLSNVNNKITTPLLSFIAVFIIKVSAKEGLRNKSQ